MGRLKFLSNFVVCLAALSLLVSCTRDVEEKAKLKIQLPKANLAKVKNKILAAKRDQQRRKRSQNPNATGGPPWNSSLNPRSIDEVNCYAVFVSGPELGMKVNSCSESDGTEKFRFGPNAMFFNAGQLIEIDVPAGPDRRVVLAGGIAESGACRLLVPGEAPDFVNFSEPFILANQGIGELTAGEQNVTITATFNNNQKFTECDFFDPGDLPGGTPPPTGTPFDPNKSDLNFAQAADFETDRFQVFANIFGDNNGNASYVVHFCNETDNPGCDPISNSAGSTSMTEPDPVNLPDVFNAEFGSLTSPNDPGDLLNVAVKVNDPDGTNTSDRFDFRVPLVNQIHRSVGAQTTILAQGTVSSNDLSISGTVATFTLPLPPNIGVGDVIEYDSDDNSSIDNVAIISHFIDQLTVVVKDPLGQEPVATATTNQDWKIHRAFTSLSDWEAGTPNSNIFSGAISSLTQGNRDLTSTNEAWVVSVYDGGSSGAGLNLTGWTSQDEFSIKIQAPRHFSEVGDPQRHEGVFDISRHFLKADDASPLGIPPTVQSLTIDGLQIAINHTTGGTASAINIDSSAGIVTIKNSIIKAVNSGNAQGAGIKAPTSGTAHLEIVNNLIYGFDGSGAALGIDATGPTTQVIYNNTIADSRTGIAGTTNTIAKNNLASVTSASGFGGTFNSASDFNSTNGTNSTGGSNDLNSQTFTFVDPTNNDFHLDPTDTGALGHGTDLFNDPGFPVQEDYEGTPRNSSLAIPFDIGADQLGVGNFTSFGGHYFVLTQASFNGNLGGLAGANAACLTELDSTNWREKDKVTLDPTTVRAFLCDQFGCNDPLPNTMYEFATATLPANGGGVFFTDNLGVGPHNSLSWGAVEQFGVTTPYWTGRSTGGPTQWAGPAANHCSDWSDDTTGSQGQEGIPNNTSGSRWSNAVPNCNNTKRLICLVDSF